MAIDLVAVTVRHERRIRLLFSNSLATAAYTSTTFYAVTSLDDAGASPGVQKALVVANSPNVIELQLDTDLVQGGRYRVSAVGVPAVDSSITPDPSSLDATVAREPGAASLGAPGPITSLERTLYGVDLLWNGSDFAEAPSGDLAEVSGLRCATEDLWRRLLANGLPWDPTYGLRARGEVDGAATGLFALRGRAIAETRKDDRVTAADATVDISDPEAPVLEVVPTFVGARAGSAPVRIPLRTG